MADRHSIGSISFAVSLGQSYAIDAPTLARGWTISRPLTVIGGRPTPFYRQCFIREEPRQFHVIDAASLVNGWNNSSPSVSLLLSSFGPTRRPSAVTDSCPTAFHRQCHLQGAWPIPYHRCCSFSERLGQLDAIDSIALKKFWAAGKPSAVTGSWPTPFHRQRLIRSEHGQSYAVDAASLVRGVANSRPSVPLLRSSFGPSEGHWQ